jgi:hypothetical protein
MSSHDISIGDKASSRCHGGQENYRKKMLDSGIARDYIGRDDEEGDPVQGVSN